jgi:hypothetical protein
MKRGAIITGGAEHFQRGQKTGFYRKDGAGMGE